MDETLCSDLTCLLQHGLDRLNLVPFSLLRVLPKHSFIPCSVTLLLRSSELVLFLSDLIWYLSR